MTQRYRLEVIQVHHVTVDVDVEEEVEGKEEASEHAKQGGGEITDVWQEEPTIKHIVKLEG